MSLDIFHGYNELDVQFLITSHWRIVWSRTINKPKRYFNEFHNCKASQNDHWVVPIVRHWAINELWRFVSELQCIADSCSFVLVWKWQSSITVASFILVPSSDKPANSCLTDFGFSLHLAYKYAQLALELRVSSRSILIIVWASQDVTLVQACICNLCCLSSCVQVTGSTA